MPRALITGITGQDGGYLADHLLGLGYDVWGLVRGAEDREAHRRLPAEVRPVHGDLLDQAGLVRAVEAARPEEVYNLAALPLCRPTCDRAAMSMSVNGLGVVRLLEALRMVNGLSESRPGPAGQTRVFQASSARMFAAAPGTLAVHETTPLSPACSCGAAKAYAHHTLRNYRKRYGMYAVGGIMFDHESPFGRASSFARWACASAVQARRSATPAPEFGDLDDRREWGFAGDHMVAAHAMLQRPHPRDYVIGTGELRTRRAFVEAAFAAAGARWKPGDADGGAHGGPRRAGAEPVAALRADARRARHELGWTSRTSFDELVEMMVEAETRRSGP